MNLLTSHLKGVHTPAAPASCYISPLLLAPGQSRMWPLPPLLAPGLLLLRLAMVTAQVLIRPHQTKHIMDLFPVLGTVTHMGRFPQDGNLP